MNIYEKISKVMDSIQYLTKDDHVQFNSTNYKAISEEKVTSIVRAALIENGIVIVPIEQSHRRDGTLSTVDVKYRIQNVEDVNDFIIACSSGTGADTQDKGVGKAMTYAYKYLLLRTFAIPTGEDPDKISSAELDKQDAKIAAEQKAAEASKPVLVGKDHMIVLANELTRTGWDVGSMLEFVGKKFNCKLAKIEEMTIQQFTYIMPLLKKKRDKAAQNG